MPNYTTIAEVTQTLPTVSTRCYLVSNTPGGGYLKEFPAQAIPVNIENFGGDHNYNNLASGHYDSKPVLCVNNGVITSAVDNHVLEVNPASVQENAAQKNVEANLAKACLKTWRKTAKMPVLPVRCKNVPGYFHKEKFGSGSKGKCIESKGVWYTPTEFELFSGRGSSKDWKRSIKFGGKPLDWLIEHKLILPHAISCTCGICCDNDPSLSGPVRIFTPYNRRRARNDGRYFKNRQHIRMHDKTKKKFSTETTGIRSSIEYSNAIPELNVILNRINDVAQTLTDVMREVNKCREDMRTLDEKYGLNAIPLIPPLVQIEDCKLTCENCNHPAIGGCGKCYGIGYCSVFCQKRDWDSHKSVCIGHSSIEIIT